MVEVCSGACIVMDDAILISNLNDFIFCPVSIYFHGLYGDRSTITYQGSSQIKGTSAHEAVDKGTYSTRKNIITAMDVYSEKYNLVGKIDMYDSESKILTERKRQIKVIYDGYVFQLYAQYFALCEMGYDVKKIRFHSMVDNKNYDIKLPEEDAEMLHKFETVIEDMKQFTLDKFVQENIEKCRNCIYEPACDRGTL
jgi:CRISPR-associated protein Cas4